MEDKAHITPIILRWARESAKMSKVTAAAELSISIVKLEEWESGLSQPTIKEAQIAAKMYKRPFAVLFLPEIPKGFRILKDF